MGDQGIKAQIGNIADNLLNLEINTIIKPNITGRKMPAPRHALIDIAQEFDAKLTALGLPPEILPNQTINLGSIDSFDRLRKRANKGLNRIEEDEKGRAVAAEKEVELMMLYRIRNVSDQIKGMFNSVQLRGVKEWDNDYTRADIESKRPPFPLTPDELVLIRKIWEIGVEEIALQTIIQMDGDIVTRVHPRFATQHHEELHRIHNQSVSVSLSMWKELIGVVKDFFVSIVEWLFVRK